MGQAILKTTHDISAVQLAPAGIVRHVVPRQGNEKALGHDLLADSRRDAGARKAIARDAITFVGPVRLIQNGKMAIIARKPIFRPSNDPDDFWGFVIVLIDLDTLLNNQPLLTNNPDLAWRLFGEDPDNNKSTGHPLIAESANAGAVETWDLSYDIVVPNGRWRMQLADVKPSSNQWLLWQILAVFVTALFCWAFYQYLKHQNGLAIRLRYERHFAGFSNTLAADKTDAMSYCLQDPLDAAQCSRVYIFENFVDQEQRPAFRQTHEVCAHGVACQLDNPKLQHVLWEQDGFERWQTELSHDRVINGVIATFPPAERAILEPQGIKSILISAWPKSDFQLKRQCVRIQRHCQSLVDFVIAPSQDCAEDAPRNPVTH
ncbi:CHASE domain-containing protein [Thiorhodovibrio litoralis]|uniref:CHASE domain-containing protein n=1 Tax=Thiorhodovibrio litoralis TaxID=2952932 RepID=UPI002B2581A5|nr:CHASE domain-containing protein [Thiorhodovibrio litoralis]